MEVIVENNFYLVTVSVEVCLCVCVCVWLWGYKLLSLKVPKAGFILDIKDKSACLVDNVLMNT